MLDDIYTEANDEIGKIDARLELERFHIEPVSI